MKKYKIIKSFPNPNVEFKVGQIITECGYKGTCDIAENWPEYFEEVEGPIFTTEDGQEFYSITGICYWLDLKDGRTGKQPFITETLKDSTNYKYYSTQELAKEAAKKLTRRFSIKDIEEALDSLEIPSWMNSTYIPTQFKQKLGI